MGIRNKVATSFYTEMASDMRSMVEYGEVW